MQRWMEEQFEEERWLGDGLDPKAMAEVTIFLVILVIALGSLCVGHWVTHLPQ